MQETYIDTRSCLDEEGLLHTFRYFLLTRQIPAGSFSFQEYGVMVDEPGVHSARVCNVTHSYPKIRELMALLVQHAVTPIHLPDVVEDWTKENHLPQPEPQQVVDVG